ncbi:MAG: 2'-5' RNA ligase family protein, partial [Bacteroidia bacterium]
SVSRLINSKLIGKPVIVGGGERGVVAACSYETRVFGVHSAMPIKIAKRLCPEAIIIRGDYDEYSKRSDEVIQIVKEEVPLYERSSIDEFYMDLSGMDKFFGCYKHATELRQKIIKETGLPISLGMSANKTVSKVATDEAKPNNQKQVLFGDEKTFLAPLSVRKIPMIGEKTYHLLRTMGVEKVQTLQDMPMELLQNVLGENGISIWKKANGIDNNPVEPYTEQKSMSQEETFENDTIDVEKLTNILIAMSDKLCFRLRSENKLTGCVTVKIRYSNFDTHNMQCRIPYSCSDHTIIARVKELFNKLYNRRMLIRLVGVKFSHLVGGGHQVNMFEDKVHILNLYHAMDRMRLRYGEDKIQRAAALHFSLRGFNPFNGISSSPAAAQDADDSYVVPSIKNLNTLINLKNKTETGTQNAVQQQAYEYLLLISPPAHIKNEIMEIKNEFHAKLNHIQAIKSKPHITLINFGFNTAFEKDLVLKINEVMKTHTTFDVRLKNFNHFRTHTIYIRVETEKPIINLVRSLHSSLTLPSSQSFFAWKPHMTIAKGLTENKFNEAMPEFETKNFEASFITEYILLMKRNASFAKYEIVKEFSLSTNVS